MAGLDGLFGGRRWLLADGGLGTSFFAQGLPAGDSPEVWNVTRRQSVRAAHAAFLAAGSDLILTNSFGANRPRLELHRQGDQVAALNRAAAEVACDAVEDHRRRTGKPAWVAGSMGPTGSLFTPLGPLTDDAAVAIFTEQATALAAGGVDLLWVETMSDEAEVKTAVAAARATGLPVVCTMSFDTHQRTMMGVAPADFAGFGQPGTAHPTRLAPIAASAPPRRWTRSSTSPPRRHLATWRSRAIAGCRLSTRARCVIGRRPRPWPTMRVWRVTPGRGSSGGAVVPGRSMSGRWRPPWRIARRAAGVIVTVSRPFLVCRGTWRARPRHVGIGGGGDKSHGDTKNLAILTKWLQNTRLGGGPTFGVALYTVTKRSITRVGESSAGFGGLDGEKRRASRIGDEFGDHAGDRGRAAGRGNRRA